MKKYDEIVVEISPEILAKFEALPNCTRSRVWTKEIDDVLLKYWPIKRHDDIAKILGIPAGTLRGRYRKLVEEQE